MKLIVAEPGHFHAALLQKEMYPALERRASVYASLGSDAFEYLARVARFNARADNPTVWDLDVHFSAHPMEELVRDRAGDIVIFAGRNRGKIDRILQALEAGFHVLADKPWIIEARDLSKLEQALALADERGLVAYDIMTERYEVTSELQREFASDPQVFGGLETGSETRPAIALFSAHHIMKAVAGVPLRRPPWFFDIETQGEGLSDVGTHLVDLAQWTAFPDRAIDAASDVRVSGARRWPLALTAQQLSAATGESFTHGIDYYCNNSVDYTLRGAHIRVEAVWNWEAPPGCGDIYTAIFRGGRATLDLRQGEAERFRPELYIVPAPSASRVEVFGAARKRIEQLQSRWPGLDALESGGELRLSIPERFRVGHEAHFAQVANRFFDYVSAPGSMPTWERPSMVAKYFVSAGGVEAGRNRGSGSQSLSQDATGAATPSPKR
jgi:predicted dehydrogenase